MGWIPCSGKSSGKTKKRSDSDENLSRNCSVSASGTLAKSDALNHIIFDSGFNLSKTKL